MVGTTLNQSKSTLPGYNCRVYVFGKGFKFSLSDTGALSQLPDWPVLFCKLKSKVNSPAKFYISLSFIFSFWCKNEIRIVQGPYTDR